jgi:BlaI family penicillinase repressor
VINAHKGIANWLGIKPKAARAPVLGRRELVVLDVLWQHGELAAQEVLARMGTATIGLSTVQTTLERLYRKNLLIRSKRGRAYRYSASISKSDIISNLLRDIATEIAGGDTTVMVSGFMDYIASAAPDSTADKQDKIINSGDSDD